jgi:DNA-binding beta-propeller fold protein YncE
MTGRILRIAVCIGFSGLWLHGQQGHISGPVSGYVFDSGAHALRPILGIPGASLLGAPVDFGIDVAAVAVSPRQNAAFVTATDGAFRLFRIDAGAVAQVQVDGLWGAPDRVVFSPSGTAAALYEGGSAQIVTGLPDAPSAAGSLDLSALNSPDSLALSDDGAVLLASSGNSVHLFGNFNDLGSITSIAGPAPLAFAPGGHDAAIGDLSGAGILLFHDLTGSGDVRTLAAPDDALGASSALAFSADGKRLLVANSKGQSVIAFDVAAGSRTATACSCSPTALIPLGSLFRLNDLGHDPLWLLDAQASDPRIVFVPALQSE